MTKAKRRSQRLLSTRNIFNNKNDTAVNLLARVCRQIESDYKKLNHIRGSIKRATRPKTLQRLADDLAVLTNELGLAPPTSYDKEKLLSKIKHYHKRNMFLRFAAIKQAIIDLCVNYEDFIRRIVMKYYEEDIRRLKLNKNITSSRNIVDALLRNDNIHYMLAEKATDEVMYGSVDDWHKHLKTVLKMQTSLPKEVKEVFLVRHCIIHNNNKASSLLYELDGQKYALRKPIHIDEQRVDEFRDHLHDSVNYLIREYSRLFPTNGGTWHGFKTQNNES